MCIWHWKWSLAEHIQWAKHCLKWTQSPWLLCWATQSGGRHRATHWGSACRTGNFETCFSIHTDDVKCYIKMLFTFMNELLEPCCWPWIVGDWSLSQSPNGRNLKTSKIWNRIKTEEGGESKQHWPFQQQTGFWSCCCCCFNDPLIQAPSIHPWKKKTVSKMAAASHCPPESSQLTDVQILWTVWLASFRGS